MSESVWFREVSEGLQKLISSKIVFMDKDGVSHPVKVSVRKPDEDLKKEEYPMVTIYGLFARRDDRHYDFSSQIISRNPSIHTMVSENAAYSFKIFFQIDFWSTLQSDMDFMTRKWLSTFFHGFSLEVTDLSGKTRQCLVTQTDTLGRADLVKDNERVFHQFLTLEVLVELDENEQKDLPMITEAHVL